MTENQLDDPRLISCTAGQLHWLIYTAAYAILREQHNIRAGDIETPTRIAASVVSAALTDEREPA